MRRLNNNELILLAMNEIGSPATVSQILNTFNTYRQKMGDAPRPNIGYEMYERRNPNGFFGWRKNHRAELKTGQSYCAGAFSRYVKPVGEDALTLTYEGRQRIPALLKRFSAQRT